MARNSFSTSSKGWKQKVQQEYAAMTSEQRAEALSLLVAQGEVYEPGMCEHDCAQFEEMNLEHRFRVNTLSRMAREDSLVGRRVANMLGFFDGSDPVPTAS